MAESEAATAVEAEAVTAVEAEAATVTAADLKRKHHELESQPDVNGKESDPVERTEGENKEEQKEEDEAIDAKRSRLDGEEEVKPQDLVIYENGVRELKEKEFVEEENKPSEEKNIEATEEAPMGLHSEQPSTDDHLAGNLQPHLKENPQNESQEPSDAELLEPSAGDCQQVDDPLLKGPPASESESISRKIDVPNNKVGVLIGKGGETIRSLQFNSGAKIQIMRDADVDPQSTNRPLELVGSLESINKAEKLIWDVIAEADAGGSPALVARGFSTAQAAGAGEEVLIQVPNEKVGVIIGKGGETIKNLQTRSGARIQLVPQHLPDGDQSKERTVRVSGDKKQIERARDMIKDVINQPPRQSSSGGGYNQQSFRPRGPSSQQQWGSRGPNSAQPRGYNYQQRGPYPSQNSQYPPHGYGNYPPHAGPRSNYGSGWEQRPPSMQGPPHQGGGGYDYYSGQGQMTAAPLSGSQSNSRPAHGPGPNLSNVGPPSQGNYNYVQPHGQAGTYPGQGYGESKYENQGPGQHIYSGSQIQGSHPGFVPHDQYGKAPPSYGVPPNGPPAQNFGQQRASQPGNIPYQGGPTQQPHGQNAAPPQQTYPYAASGPLPPTYSSFGPSSEGYNQQPQPGAGSAQVYPQQHGPGYAQVGGYSSYPAPQQGYSDQSAQNNSGYGSYPGGADPAVYGSSAYGAPQTGQSGFPQPVPAQPGYDQSAPHPTGYGVVPAGDGKSVPPQPGYGQPGYDATQMYGAAPR